MSLFGLLNIGTTGMRTHQYGVQVHSNNATNAATEGYSRRRAQIDPLGPETAGSRARGQERITDPFVERRLLGARSAYGEADARSSTLESLDYLFADVEGNLGQLLSELQTAFSDMADYPDDRAARTVVLSSLDEVVRSFNQTADELSLVRRNTNDRIVGEVDDLNAKLEDIASLSTQIGRDEGISNEEAADLRDQRDQLIREVSEIVPVKVLEEDNGSISLLLGGSHALVSPDGSVNPLETSEDPVTGDIRLFRTTAGAQEDVTGLVDEGRVGGLIAARDGTLTETQTALDQLAFDLAAAYNTAHAAGVGLDGVGGRDLFEPLVGVDGAASLLRVSTDVAGVPDNLAAAQAGGALPGDNRNALALLAVGDQNTALGGTATFQEGYGAILGSVGTAARTAMNNAEQTETGMAQIEALRAEVSGVSSDEEMVSLMQFQRAYQASLQVIQTADSLLAELINLRG
ncbi:MAG: flagellar hook-associated protein FlgK [Myxococcota bacterium]